MDYVNGRIFIHFIAPCRVTPRRAGYVVFIINSRSSYSWIDHFRRIHRSFADANKSSSISTVLSVLVVGFRFDTTCTHFHDFSITVSRIIACIRINTNWMTVVLLRVMHVPYNEIVVNEFPKNSLHLPKRIRSFHSSARCGWRFNARVSYLSVSISSLSDRFL